MYILNSTCIRLIMKIIYRDCTFMQISCTIFYCLSIIYPVLWCINPIMRVFCPVIYFVNLNIACTVCIWKMKRISNIWAFGLLNCNMLNIRGLNFWGDLKQKGVASKFNTVKHYFIHILNLKKNGRVLLGTSNWYYFLLNRMYVLLSCTPQIQSRRYGTMWCTIDTKSYERLDKLELWDDVPAAEAKSYVRHSLL